MLNRSWRTVAKLLLMLMMVSFRMLLLPTYLQPLRKGRQLGLEQQGRVSNVSRGLWYSVHLGFPRVGLLHVVMYMSQSLSQVLHYLW